MNLENGLSLDENLQSVTWVYWFKLDNITGETDAVGKIEKFTNLQSEKEIKEKDDNIKKFVKKHCFTEA